MFRNIVQVSENIIKMYYHTNIEETKKMLFINCCRGIGKAKRYNCLFKEFIVSAEDCF